ncbi:MAG TPA: GHMP kinase [Candidatus Brocadiia bacterium]|nr:GHMP kinase [Candidatus Brocadiia bacterium]
MRKAKVLKTINSVAPIRICDNGGWTDTWFSGHGKIFNIGVYPYAEVQMHVMEYTGQKDRIIIHAENYGERYVVNPQAGSYDKHPLLEAAIEYMRVPDNVAFEVNIYSEAPSGCSTGTSAAVTVALVGALDTLTPGRMTPHEIARTAHAIETDMLKQQCGIQDQFCSAYGGINYIEMPSYPQAVVSQIQVSNNIWWELERRLALIFLGQTHSSSSVHEMVIKDLEGAGPDCAKLEDLRGTAERSKNAVYAGDFIALGRAMIDNAAAQKRLHPKLVSDDAAAIIEIAKGHGAIGWKINGAGGEGGSVTLLCGPDLSQKRSMIKAIEASNPIFRNIPIYLSRYGVRVWEA